MSVFDTLLALERAGWDSLCDGSGSRFYGELMVPDGVMVLANGMVMDRNSVVEALAQSPPWRAYEIREPRLIELGEAAAVTYVGVAYREGADPAFTGAMSSVYHHRGGQWKLALYQQTQIPH